MESKVITPKQAYEAAKILWPGAAYIRKTPLGWQAMEIHADGRAYAITYGSGVTIDWGDTDQYPLPEPEWVDAVFPQDVGKQGRFSQDGKHWVCGTVCGQWQEGLWISCDFSWKFCQVRKEQTS